MIKRDLPYIILGLALVYIGYVWGQDKDLIATFKRYDIEDKFRKTDAYVLHHGSMMSSPVAIVYGYGDDRGMCERIAKMLNEAYQTKLAYCTRMKIGM